MTLFSQKPCVCAKKVVPLQRKTNVLPYLARAEGICLSGGMKYGHIEKGVLSALCLVSLNLANSKSQLQDIAAKMSSGCVSPALYLLGYSACVHISVGFSVVCFELKAMREPKETEQQHCSPAFLFVYMEII